jgi:hypothetical protein
VPLPHPLDGSRIDSGPAGPSPQAATGAAGIRWSGNESPWWGGRRRGAGVSPHPRSEGAKIANSGLSGRSRESSLTRCPQTSPLGAVCRPKSGAPVSTPRPLSAIRKRLLQWASRGRDCTSKEQRAYVKALRWVECPIGLESDPGIPGGIISERWAASSRNGGRHHSGIVGGFARNPQQVGSKLKTASEYAKSDHYYGDIFNKIALISLPKGQSFREVLPLQAADFFIWELRKNHLNLDEWFVLDGKPADSDERWRHLQEWSFRRFGSENGKPRKSLAAIVERSAPPTGIIWDYDRICETHRLRSGIWSAGPTKIDDAIRGASPHR